MQPRTVSVLVSFALLLLLPLPAPAFSIAPSVAFTARGFPDGEILLVGNGCCLLVQSNDTFEDHVILEFALAGASASPGPVYLNFYAANTDRTNDFLGPGEHVGTIRVFAFLGDGTRDLTTFNATDVLVGELTDAGVPVGYGDWVAMSLDVTAAYTQALGGAEALGFALAAAEPFPAGPRYVVGFEGMGDSRVAAALALRTEPLPVLGPPPPPEIPEPPTLILLGSGLVLLAIRLRLRTSKEG